MAPKKKRAPVAPVPPQEAGTPRYHYPLGAITAVVGAITAIITVVILIAQSKTQQAAPELRRAAEPRAEVVPALLRFAPPNRPGQTVTYYHHTKEKRGRPSSITWEPIFFTKTFDVAMIVRSPAVGESETITYFERWRQDNAGNEDHSLEGALVRQSTTASVVQSASLTPDAKTWLERVPSGLLVGDVFDPGVPVNKGFTWSLPQPILEKVASAVVTANPESPSRAELDTANTTSKFTILSLEPGKATFVGQISVVVRSVTVDGERVPTRNVPFQMTVHGEISTSAGEWTGYEVTGSFQYAHAFQGHARGLSAYTFDFQTITGARPGGVIPAAK